MSLAKSLPQVCRNKRLDTVQTPGGNVVSLQGSMILASRGFSVIFPQGLTNSMASVVFLDISISDEMPGPWRRLYFLRRELLYNDFNLRRDARPLAKIRRAHV